MEKLKEPEMFLSVVNTAGLIGVAGYFYKQMELIRQDQEKIARALKTTINKLGELEKLNQGKSEDIKSISSQIKNIGEQVATIEHDMDFDVEEIIHTLEKHDINIERQVYAPPQRQKKHSRAVKGRDVDTDVSSRSGRSAQSSRSERADRKPSRQKQQDNHSDDDSDLINAVREDSRHPDEEFTARR